MKFRGLIVSLIVLVVFLGLLYWSQRESAAKTSAAAPSVPPSPKILALNQADIVKVEIKKPGSDDVVLSKNGSGAWQITSPKEFTADSSVVSGLLSTLSSLNAERVVDEKASDLKSGLIKEIKSILDSIGSEDKYLLIVSAENAPYYQKAIDLTDKVIMRYNELQGTK
jgi:hypothetical protein